MRSPPPCDPRRFAPSCPNVAPETWSTGLQAGRGRIEKFDSGEKQCRRILNPLCSLECPVWLIPNRSLCFDHLKIVAARMGSGLFSGIKI